MTSKTFTCYKCKNTYEKGWSDEEASFEACVNFSEELEKGHDFDVVCDDCYNDFKKWILKKA